MRSTLEAPSLTVEVDETPLTDDIGLAPFIPVVDDAESSSLGVRVSPMSLSATLHASTSSTRAASSSTGIEDSERESMALARMRDSEEPPRVKADQGEHLALAHSQGEAMTLSTPASPPMGGPLSALNRIILDTWLCEIVATIFSSACITAIAILVYKYDQEPLPEFPSGITLNTIVSILSTSSRSAIVLTASTSISQLKWCRYKGSAKSVRDLQIMDDASRGPFGAGSMLTLRAGGIMAAIGGLVMVLMVAFSPLFQQLLAYPTRHPRLITKEAGALQNLNYTVVPAFMPGSDLQVAILAGLHGESHFFDRNPSCPTANCEWDNYKSVGWCNKCENVTAITSFEDCDWSGYLSRGTPDPSESRFYVCNVKVGKGRSISVMVMANTTSSAPAIPTLERQFAYTAIWTISSPDGTSPSETYTGVENPLLVMGHVVFKVTWKDGVWKDSEIDTLSLLNVDQCLLTVCEREYSVSVKDGIPSSKVLSTNYGHLFSWKPARYLDSVSPRLGWRPGPTNVTLSISDIYERYLNQSERAFWPVGPYIPYIIDQLQANGSAVQPFQYNWSTPTADAFFRTSNPTIIDAFFYWNLTKSFDSIAASLTRYGLDQSKHSFAGYAISEEIIVDVRWPWIALPVILQTSTIALFAATILRSKRIGAPIWKSSLLAIWYYGPGKAHADADLATNRLSDMTKLASTTSVELSKGDHDLGCVFRRASTKTSRTKRWSKQTR